MYQIFAGTDLLYASKNIKREYALGQPQLNQEVGKVHTLTFAISPKHPLFDSLQRMKTIIKFVEDDEILFRGRILDWDSNMRRDRKCTCEDALAYLNDTWIDKLDITRETPTAFFQRCIDRHNAMCSTERQLTVGTIDIEDRDTVAEFKISNPSNILEVINSALVNKYGGFLKVHYTEERTYVDWVEDYNIECNQTIEFAKNLIDLNDKVDGDNIFSVLIPTGKDDLKISDTITSGTETLSNGVTIQTVAGEPYIRIPEAIDRYGWIYRISSDTNDADGASVFKSGKDFIKNNYKSYPSSLTVNALDLHLLGTNVDALRVGAKVRVKSIPHGLDMDYLLKSIKLDLVHPEKTEYEFCDPEASSVSATGSASASSIASKTNQVVAGQALNIHMINSMIEMVNSKLILHDSSIMAINSSVNLISATITAIGSSISAINSTIEVMNSSIRTMGSSIETINSSISTIRSSITTMDSSIRTISSTIDTIRSSITTLESTITTIRSSIATIDSNITTIDSSIDTLRSSVSTIDSSVRTIQSSVTTLNSDITTANSSITTINSNITTINSSISIIDGRLDGLDTLVARKVEADGVIAIVDGGTFSSLNTTSLNVGGISYSPSGVCKRVSATNNNGTITFTQTWMSGGTTDIITFDTAASVTCISPQKQAGSDDVSDDYKTVYCNVRSRASNGSVGTYTRISISAASCYNQGKTDGAAGVSVTISPSSNQTLGYGGSITVKALKDGAQAASITVSARASAVTIDPSTAKTLDYGESVTVYAKRDGTSMASVRITAPALPTGTYAEGYADGWAAYWNSGNWARPGSDGIVYTPGQTPSSGRVAWFTIGLNHTLTMSRQTVEGEPYIFASTTATVTQDGNTVMTSTKQDSRWA